jgi:hypothetical protein
MAKQSVDIYVTAKDFASRQFGTISKSFGGMVGSAVRIGAAIGGVYGMIRLVKGSVGAYMEAEAAAKGLSDALATIGSDTNIEQYQTFAKQMQNITTFEDDATVAAMKLGVTIAGLAGDDLKAATQAAMGLSKAYNMDLQAAMTLVSKAAVGETGTLKRLGIVLKDGLTDAEKYAEVLRIGTDRFSMATGETETFGGMIKQMGNAWGDAKEGLGEYIAESAKLKEVFQMITFGFTNIVDVSRWAWANAKSSMSNFLEWAAGGKETWRKKFSTWFGTGFANFAATGKWDAGDPEQFKKDVEYYRNRNVYETTSFQNAEAEKMNELLGQKLAGMITGGGGAFGTGGYKGGGDRTGSGLAKVITQEQNRAWTLNESRTASGVRSESPESRKLNTVVDRLDKIYAVLSKSDKWERGKTDSLQLAVTNFR